MATWTFNIPDAVATRVINGIARRFNYSPTLPDGSANPETKAAFAKRMVKERIKEWAVDGEAGSAAETAESTARQAAENDIQIT